MEIEDKKIVQLYGGALEVTLPHDFNDLSDILPVEDNQEVFTDFKFNAKLIIEVLEWLEPDDDKAIVANFNEVSIFIYYFADSISKWLRYLFDTNL